MTHCNGAAGYLPTLASYAEGGYEVQSSAFAPGADELVVEEARRMLEGLWQRTDVDLALISARAEAFADDPAIGLIHSAVPSGDYHYRDPSLPSERRIEDLLRRMSLEEKVGQMNMPCVYEGGLGNSIAEKTSGVQQFTLGTQVKGVGPEGGFFTLPNTILHEGPRQQAEFLNQLQHLALEKTRLGIPLLETDEGTHGLMCPGGTVFPEGPGLGSTWNLEVLSKVYGIVAREARSIGVHQNFTLVIEPIRDPRLGRNQEAFAEDPFLCSRIAETIVRSMQGTNLSAPDEVVSGLCHYPGQSQPVSGFERGAMEISQRMLREVFLPSWQAGIKGCGALGVMATYPAIDAMRTDASEKILTRILKQKFRLGLFEQPFVDPERAVAIVHQQAHQDVALEAARESLVLLKNERNVLPLRKTLRSVAVIGPNADEPRNQLGDYVPARVPQHVISVLEGIKQTVSPDTKVSYVKGCGVVGTDLNEIAKAKEAAAQAVAEVLFGDINPSGHLSVTVPRHAGQLPVYYNAKKSKRYWVTGGWGRPYVDLDPTPLYPFGHELSYTRFEYGGLELSAREIGAADSVDVRMTVKNTGTRAGAEVVQLYIEDVISSVATPVKELRGFAKVSLQPGETKSCTFKLTPDDLALDDVNLRRVVEPGEFRVMVGASSEDIRLRGEFSVKSN